VNHVNPKPNRFDQAADNTVVRNGKHAEFDACIRIRSG